MKAKVIYQSAEYPTHPNEDYALCSSNRFAVFDGVTLLHQEPYPDPSPAAEAARLACETVIGAPLEVQSAQRSLREAANLANLAIRRFNESIGVTGQTVDYLNKQYAAAVGAFGFIEAGRLYGAQINDSEIAVLDKTGNFKFRLQSNVGPIGELLRYVRDRQGIRPDSPEEHVYVRGHVINNPSLEFDGRPIRAGVLTGQDIALGFLNVDSAEVLATDTVLFYTDGMTPFVESAEFRRYLATDDDFSEIEQYQKDVDAKRRERTIIIVKELK